MTILKHRAPVLTLLVAGLVATAPPHAAYADRVSVLPGLSVTGCDASGGKLTRTARDGKVTCVIKRTAESNGQVHRVPRRSSNSAANSALPPGRGDQADTSGSALPPPRGQSNASGSKLPPTRGEVAPGEPHPDSSTPPPRPRQG